MDLILADHMEQHALDGPVEHEKTEMLAAYQFQILRALGMQTGYLEVALARHEAAIDGEFENISANGFMGEVFRRMAKEDDTFRLLLRYTNDLRRAYNQKLRELHSLQDRRKASASAVEANPKLPVEPEASPRAHPPVEPETELQVDLSAIALAKAEPQPIRLPQVGRNTPCPCGSGVKYKRCCIGKPQPSPIPIAA